MKIGPFGLPEIAIIVIAFLIFFVFLGPKNLPKLGTAIGKSVKNFREGLSGGKKAEEAKAEEPKAKDDEIEVEVIDKPAPGAKPAPSGEEAKKEEA